MIKEAFRSDGSSQSDTNDDVFAKINKLKELLDKGAITQQEFETKELIVIETIGIEEGIYAGIHALIVQLRGKYSDTSRSCDFCGSRVVSLMTKLNLCCRDNMSKCNVKISRAADFAAVAVIGYPCSVRAAVKI